MVENPRELSLALFEGSAASRSLKTGQKLLVQHLDGVRSRADFGEMKMRWSSTGFLSHAAAVTLPVSPFVSGLFDMAYRHGNAYTATLL